MNLRYFNNNDFINANPSCSIDDMDSTFMIMLDTARHRSDQLAQMEGESCVYVINSAFRTVEYELSKGRSGSSSHTKRVAVDIRYRSSRECYYIVSGLLFAGFHRIGIGNGFIHVDIDDSKDGRVIFNYY